MKQALARQTEYHSIRVGWISYELAIRMGLSPDLAGIVWKAGQVHDTGKNSLPPLTFMRRGPQTLIDQTISVLHPLLSWHFAIKHKMDPLIAQLCRLHHEKEDGSGYYHWEIGAFPEPLRTLIRIIVVADIFEALTAQNRPYRQPLTPADAIALMSTMPLHNRTLEILGLTLAN